MPLKTSSRSSSAGRLSRKVSVDTEKSKGSGDGVRTIGSKDKTTDRANEKKKVASRTSSDDVRNKTTDRAHEKKKVASRTSSDDVRNEERSTGDVPRRKVRGDVGKSKKTSADGGTVEWKEKMIKKINTSRGNGKDGGRYVDADEKSSKSRGRGLRDLRAKGRNEGYEAVVDGDGGRKRKRYAGAGGGDDGLYEKKLDRRNYVSKPRDNLVEPYSDKVKNRLPRRSRDSEASGKGESYAGKGNSSEVKLRKRKNVRGRLDGAVKPRPVKVRRLGNRTIKKTDRCNGLLLRRTDMLESKRGIDYSDRPRRNKVTGNKSLASKSELTEDRARRKKQIIRIDLHDVSQKRLDDSLPNEGTSQGNKELPETSEGEMSKNAQFRAIIPSSSILSFVDDNLIGRRREIDFRKAGYNIEISSPLDNIPFSISSERERVEEPVFRNKLDFFAASKTSSSFPLPELPEIAFAGRSNVGKSSLLNSLTRQWGVVRTSDKPGLTQTINFFKLGPKLSLVDLPGYGFAFAKDEVKEAWEELVKEYVSSRANLKRVCLLIDTRWGLKPRDHELIDIMERSQTKYQIILTKTDVVFPMDVARRAMQIEEKLKAKKSAVQPLMMVSSKSGAGIRSLRTALASIVRFAKR